MDTVESQFAASVSAMATRYPTLEVRYEERDGVTVAIWEGWLQPIRTRAGLNSIVCDLDEDRAIMIDRDTGTINHDPQCERAHRDHRILKKIKRPDRRFFVRIEYVGSRSHPTAFLVDPVVTPATRFHIFGTNRICAYAPWTDAWKAGEHDVADFTDHVLVWVFKWNTCVETGHWLGSEEDHKPLYLLSTIRPDKQCWCGSGVPYGDCCRSEDQLKVNAELQRMLSTRSRLYQKPDIDYSKLPTLSAFLFPAMRTRRSLNRPSKGTLNAKAKGQT